MMNWATRVGKLGFGLKSSRRLTSFSEMQVLNTHSLLPKADSRPLIQRAIFQRSNARNGAVQEG
jgi:hypothetical protein